MKEYSVPPKSIPPKVVDLMRKIIKEINTITVEELVKEIKQIRKDLLVKLHDELKINQEWLNNLLRKTPL